MSDADRDELAATLVERIVASAQDRGVTVEDDAVDVLRGLADEGAGRMVDEGRIDDPSVQLATTNAELLVDRVIEIKPSSVTRLSASDIELAAPLGIWPFWPHR